jgi:uncharacterized protein YdiU (UPF0061 family)
MLTFDDRFVRELPGDPSEVNVPRAVRGAAFTRVMPTAVRAPKLVHFAREVAADLGLSEADLARPELVEALAGNRVLDGMKPYAACYGGHQFGHWAGQLGDGRAITLGEVRTPSGRPLELQLKGAGRTPYSRTADGRAVLRSSLRELVCSEAMHHLGVPTTRALSLVLTGEDVVRDILYDGNAAPEPGAVVARVAPSFVRFGNFEIFASRREHEMLRRLADHVIRAHYPELLPASGVPERATYAAFLAEVARRTAVMVMEWMRVGFVHGVMNTDNMSILGLTIDYGPYGWLEPFDPDWTPNTTDAGGRRYRYGHQPRVAGWNLTRLVESLEPLVVEEADLVAALETYGRTLASCEHAMLARKLGLRELVVDGLETDAPLVQSLYRLLAETEIDYTIFHRALADVPIDEASLASPSEADLARWIGEAYYDAATLTGAHATAMSSWLQSYAARVRRDAWPERRETMRRANPRYVLRNWLAQEAIDAVAAGDFAPLVTLLDVMRAPYDDQPGREHYAAKRPEWARHKPGCSMLSCSS